MKTATLLALALALVTPPSALAAPGAAQGKGSAANIGRVSSAGAGAMKIRDTTQSPLHAGEELKSGDIISTGREPVILVLHEGSVTGALKLKANTSLKLDGVAGKGIEAELRRGMLLSDIHNPSGLKNPYQIRTRTAVMGVRGTIFFVKDEPGKSLFLCACHGKIATKPAQGAGKEEMFEGTHHDHPVMISEKEGAIAARATPAPMGDDHSDSEAAELEGLLK